MSEQYDALVVLGSQPDPKTWIFPAQIYDCLDLTMNLFQNGAANCIVTSGDHTINFDREGIRQPVPECDMMARYLIEKGVSDLDILRERFSKDSISNLYYLKEKIFLEHKMTSIGFVVASFRVPRLEFLTRKILGKEIKVGFEIVEADPGPSYNEADTMRRQQEFLLPMKDGDHRWLDGKFFSHPFYAESHSGNNNQNLKRQ